MELYSDTNFGFEPSVMDGTEWVFASPEEVKLPKKYSYRPYLPPVIDQGSLSICVPCSCSAYLNWKQNLNDGQPTDNKVAMLDIYSIRTNAGEGMSFKEALHYLRHEGVRSNAGILKINAYGKILNQIDLKYALVMNGPCLGALPVYSNTCDFWNKYQGQNLYGYHAISIVGYDEEGFIIRNSWGRGFCDLGYAKMSYEDFDKFLELWTFID